MREVRFAHRPFAVFGNGLLTATLISAFRPLRVDVPAFQIPDATMSAGTARYAVFHILDNIAREAGCLSAVEWIG
jgi:hypothetical protein